MTDLIIWKSANIVVSGANLKVFEIILNDNYNLSGYFRALL